jgi:hypothetical protein
MLEIGWFGAVGATGTGHALAQAAFLKKVAFESAQLLIEEVVGELDQACKCPTPQGTVVYA